jgi:glycerophosphoryl diester phosphodiesterase
MRQGNFDSFDANRFVIDSHRGAFKEGLLENTVEAFMQSYREGANVMECDIRLTKDNQIVLIHNGTIDHIASFAEKIPDRNEFNEEPTGSVRSHSLAYLKALKFPNNAQLMTLLELLNFLNRIKVGAQIELKEGGYEDAILKTIEAAEIDYEALLGPIVCTSFNYVAVMRLVKKAKKYKYHYTPIREPPDWHLDSRPCQSALFSAISF